MAEKLKYLNRLVSSKFYNSDTLQTICGNFGSDARVQFLIPVPNFEKNSVVLKIALVSGTKSSIIAEIVFVIDDRGIPEKVHGEEFSNHFIFELANETHIPCEFMELRLNSFINEIFSEVSSYDVKYFDLQLELASALFCDVITSVIRKFHTINNEENHDENNNENI